MNRITYYLKEGFRNIFAHRLSSGLTIIIILACLLIMGSCGLLALNVDFIIANLEAQNPVLAFVDDSVDAEGIKELEKTIAATDNVADVEFVSRAEAMKNFLSRLQYSSLFEDVDESVFRNRFLIYLDDIQFMAKTQNDIAGMEGVAKVNAHLGISHGFVTTRRVVTTVSVCMAVLLICVCMAMMVSALRVTTYERRNEVGIAKMIGASNSFIRFPLTIEGAILGLVGAGLAYLVESSIYQVVFSKLSESGMDFLTMIPFAQLSLELLIAFGAVGLVTAVVGSRIAIRNYIRV